MIKSDANNLKNNGFIKYGIVFVILFFLCLLFPYSGDDWTWGSQYGLDRLAIWFDNYSGRYLGNLIVLALTRSYLLKTVAISFCMTGIVFILNKLTGEQKNGIFIISTVLMFMPVEMLSQSIVWTSGFANYTTSIFFTLIYIYYVNNIYSTDKLKQSPLAAVPMLILGACATLVVEHVTLYNIILAVYVIVFTIIKFKKVYVQHIAYFAGTIAGTALMFSNSVYRSVADGSDSYRTISDDDGIIVRALKAYFEIIVPQGFFDNMIMNVFLAVVCLIIWFCVKDKLSNKSKALGTIAITVMVAFAASSIILNISNVKALLVLSVVKGAATAAYIIAFIVFLFILPFEINKKAKLLFILGSVGCLIVPLLVVTPVSRRCFFAAYVMMLYLGMELYSLFDDNVKVLCEKISKTAIVTAVVGLIYLFYIYGTITICNNERIEKAQQDAQAGAETIQVEELPYKEYVTLSDVGSDFWSIKFKMFYDIDTSVNVEQIPSNQKL